MIDLAIRRSIRCRSRVTPLLCLVALLHAAGMIFAAGQQKRVTVGRQKSLCGTSTATSMPHYMRAWSRWRALRE